MTWENDFNACVLAYLNRDRPTATRVVKVGGYGTDWAGDTEGGFYSEFGADVTYVDLDGNQRTTGFSGESMGELWDWVVSGKGSRGSSLHVVSDCRCTEISPGFVDVSDCPVHHEDWNPFPDPDADAPTPKGSE